MVYNTRGLAPGVTAIQVCCLHILGHKVEQNQAGPPFAVAYLTEGIPSKGVGYCCPCIERHTVGCWWSFLPQIGPEHAAFWSVSHCLCSWAAVEWMVAESYPHTAPCPIALVGVGGLSTLGLLRYSSPWRKEGTTVIPWVPAVAGLKLGRHL